MIRRIPIAAVAIALTLIACRDQGPGGSGVLRVRLAMPSANSGQDVAVLFTVSGPAAPTAVTPGPGLSVYRPTLAATTKYAVVGTLTANATILTLQVPDTRQPYSATIEQVAAANYQLRGLLTGYALSVGQ